MKKQTKILIVGPRLSLQSGVSNHIKTLLASPLNKVYQLSYFQVGSNPDDSALVVILKFLITPFRFLWKLWLISPDVVHFNPSFDYKSLHRELNMLAISKIHGCANVVQLHGGSLSQIIRKGHLPFYARLILNWASHLVVLTRIQKQPLLKYCAESKVSVIPNMIDISGYQKNRLNKASQFYILYMSKIESKKGIYDIIQAIHIVTEKFPNAKFLFAGDGPDREKLRCLCCENGYRDYLKFFGYLEGQQKINFLARGDLFLFPSQYVEGMPYSLLEAMAAGLPIIATSMGGIPEMIQDKVNGILIPPEQPEKLAQAIIKLLANRRLRRGFGQFNRLKVETEYEINIVCEKISQLYDRLSNHN